MCGVPKGVSERWCGETLVVCVAIKPKDVAQQSGVDGEQQRLTCGSRDERVVVSAKQSLHGDGQQPQLHDHSRSDQGKNGREQSCSLTPKTHHISIPIA